MLRAAPIIEPLAHFDLTIDFGTQLLQLGIVAALEFVPALVLAPFGGVLVDRIDKRRTLLVTQSLATLQVGVLFALTIAGLISIPTVMALSLALGVVNALDMPVRQALANSWPNNLEDYAARVEWGWNPRFDLDAMTRDMLGELKRRES